MKKSCKPFGHLWKLKETHCTFLFMHFTSWWLGCTQHVWHWLSENNALLYNLTNDVHNINDFVQRFFRCPSSFHLFGGGHAGETSKCCSPLIICIKIFGLKKKQPLTEQQSTGWKKTLAWHQLLTSIPWALPGNTDVAKVKFGFASFN